MILLICGILKNYTNELNSKTEIDSQTWKTNLWLSKGKRMGGINQELGIKLCTLLYTYIYMQITNKDLLYSTGNYTQYLVVVYNGKESKNNIYIYIYTYIHIYTYITE